MPADWGPLGFSPCSECPDLRCDVAEAQPAIALHALRNGALIRDWWPVPDLLSSTEFQHQFVTDVDDTGRPILRFGDGQYGELFTGVDPVDVWYRVGNGITGNIGADSLAHIVVPDPVPPGWPVIRPLRNPLPTAGGVDPELINVVRRYAPAAFRATQFRAVTEQDYKQAALTIKGVAGALASFRWTGSW